MRINYTPEARDDLKAIRSYIAEHNFNAADRVIFRILQSIAYLETFPLMGRPGRVEETRELILPGLPYFAVYRVADESEIDVIAIVHGRRAYP